MKKIMIGAAAAASCFTAAAPALGDDVRLRAVRVDAADVEALAAFYTDAFGLQETRRLEGPTFLEIIMNFGETAEEAAGNDAPPFVILSRPEGASASPVAAVILEVADMDAAMARVVELGGSVASEPALSGTLTYAFVLDPEGNRVELLSE